MKSYLLNLYATSLKLCKSNTLSLFEENPSATLLDLGCDDGTWTQQMGEKALTYNLIGIEGNPKAFQLAKQKLKHVINQDLDTKWDLANESVDVVHSSFVIEHVSDIDHFVSETFRVLKPQGYVVVSTENGSSWHNIFASILGWQTFTSSCCSIKAEGLGNPLAMHRGQSSTHKTIHDRHKVILNYRGFIELFEVHGFKIEVIKGAGYHPLHPKLGTIDKRHAHFLTLKARKL